MSSHTRLPMIGNGEALLDRRGFIAQSATLAAIAALSGACTTSPFGLQLDSQVTVNLSEYPALAGPGGVARLTGTNVPIAVANLGGGEYTALSLICPHQGGAISWEGEFVCAEHSARFAADGHWIGGQPTGNMAEYRTSYDAGAGVVTIFP